MTSIRFFNTIALFFSFSILVAQTPPANNSISTATELTVQSGSCSSQTQGDLTHATNTNNSDYSPSCFQNPTYGKKAYADVWYKVTVPSSGKLTVETSGVQDSNLSDTLIVAYTLSDDVLTEVGCQDNKDGTDLFSKIELTEQVENTEIYVLVDEYSNHFQGSSSFLGSFNICAYDPDGTLDLPQTQKPLLSYYSNPVGNRLAVESPYQIQSLTIYDLVGREVVQQQPQKQKLTLDTYSLSTGVYMLNAATAEGQQTVKLVKK